MRKRKRGKGERMLGFGEKKGEIKGGKEIGMGQLGWNQLGWSQLG